MSCFLTSCSFSLLSIAAAMAWLMLERPSSKKPRRQHPSSMKSVGVSADPPGGSDSRETPRSRISGEERRCCGGGREREGVLNSFDPTGLILLSF